MGKLTFWYEFASTYSYLSAYRIGSLAKEFGVEIDWQPFLLGPIFQAQGWHTSPFNLYPQKGAYMWRDMERRAQNYGLPPIQEPKIFPGNGLLAARVAIQGKNGPWIAEFSRSVYHAQFARGVSISDENVLEEILSSLHLDAPRILIRAKNDDDVKESLKEATKRATDNQIFGSPSFITEKGELFWGDDRLDDALAFAVSEALNQDK